MMENQRQARQGMRRGCDGSALRGAWVLLGSWGGEAFAEGARCPCYLAEIESSLCISFRVRIPGKQVKSGLCLLAWLFYFGLSNQQTESWRAQHAHAKLMVSCDYTYMQCRH
jgi:hypothetical protein